MRVAGKLLFSALLLGLATVVGLELRDSEVKEERPPVRANELKWTQPLQLAPATDRNAEWVTAMLARPLFAPNRRPPEAVATSADVAPTLPRLTGILVSRNIRRVIFAATANGRPAIVAEGGTFNGFWVQLIEPGRVVVVGPDGSQDLRPSFDPNPPPPVSPPPPPIPDFPAAATVARDLPHLLSSLRRPLAPAVTAR